ncbi:chymotrypsin-1-like [Centruroides vittatus]|uniref:chymotrypsin-1-like n=1 Tax=Centruroides vittatus TaxID=120091 RepID=UPI00350E98E9
MKALGIYLIVLISQHLASGIDNKKPFIVRGTDCKDKEYPCAGALLYSNRFICTGCVIDKYFYLTAAHCVVGSGGVPAPASNFKVVLGNVSRSSNAHVHTVSKVISHEKYDDGTIANDIALMKFSKPVDFSTDYIKPICIPSKDRKFEGQKAMAVGWGRDENGNIPEVLKKVEVDVCSKGYCSFVYSLLSGGRLGISDKQICSGSRMRGVCNGDSGGPLITKIGDKFVTIGVTSFGSFLGCAFPFVPAVYTRVTHYYDWIMKNAENATMCVV